MAVPEEKTLQSNDSLDNRASFILFFAIFAILAWQVTHPLIMAILWAGMLSFMILPIFKMVCILMGGRFRSLCAGMTLCLLIILFIIPFILILASLGQEVSVLVSKVGAFISKMQLEEVKDAASLLPSWLPSWLSDYIRDFLGDSESIKVVVQKLAQWTGGFLTDISKRLIQSASSFLFEIMIVIMVSFFFIRDGENIVKYIKSFTPLSNEEKLSFFSRAKTLLNSVIYGILLSVAIQAIFGAFGWWFVGLDSPAFFGMLMFFFGMFPAGTAVIWVPGSIYLLLTGDIRNGIILLVWGTIIVSSIDNILRPFVISGGGRGRNGGEIPTLLIILGLFGGVIKWGFLGIFLGPLVLVLFVLVLEIYRARCPKLPHE